MKMSASIRITRQRVLFDFQDRFLDPLSKASPHVHLILYFLTAPKTGQAVLQPKSEMEDHNACLYHTKERSDPAASP